ncbi:MAG TPA: serine protease [Rhodocyclaceae bacterium]|nr:serine protease [Rhodocyclaceae bacterium]
MNSVLWRRLCLGMALSLLISTVAQAKPAVVVPVTQEPLSDSALDVLARSRPSIVQIRGFFGKNSAQAFHGTGFAVAPGGVFLTNYHVVAEQVMFPEKYRLEYRTPEGKTGLITVLAIDVRHDLAVVRAEGFAPPPLTLTNTIPVKGARAYSIGFPLDVGLTITEGVANGRVEDSFDARIHYSGALNGGMSGGPALNSSGQVFGINVAGYRFEQLVSFLVPAEHAKALLQRAQQQPLSLKDAKGEVVNQLRAHATELLGAFQGPLATQQTSGFILPGKLSSFVDCNASGDPSPNQPVQTEAIQCAAKAGLYVQEGLYSGDMTYQHFILTTETLDSLRFTKRLQKIAAASGRHGSKKHVGPLTCKNSNVKLQGFDANLLICTRSYRKLEGLYDFTVRVVSLDNAKRGFASHLDMNGVDFDAGMRFVRRYVETMQWKP